MQRSRGPCSKLPWATLLLTILGLTLMALVTQPAPAQKKPSLAPVTSESQASKDENIEALRSQLLELLRLSPKLTMAISADPTLLADEAYVNRNNPELAQFLHTHPEVGRNPEFYLFFPNHFPAKVGRQRFEATVWPELLGFEPRNNGWDARDITLFLVFVLILGGLLWILRLVLEHHKWNKLHKMQSELFSKLLDRSSTNEELLASFGSAGKPFVDLASIEPRANPLTRVFLPLQFGIVLAFIGGTLLFLRNSAPTESDAHKLVALGALAFTLGVGFIVSAAVSYLLARHLGLLPQQAKPDETHARD